jgi:DNA-binding CsgD family transcriptional regulator
LRIAVVLLFILFGRLQGQDLPPIRNFTPADYGAENQNWSVSQGNDKLLYIANNRGLLVYNGSSWLLYPSPNQTIMRSVRAIGDRIFAGYYMDFGYWERDPYGVLHYISLTKRLGIEMVPDEEFWTILEIEGYIIFQSLDRIYAYNPADERVAVIEAQTSITKVFEVDGALYFQRKGRGVFRVDSGSEVLVSNDPILLEEEVIGLFRGEEGLLVLTSDSGFFRLRPEGLRAWDIPANRLMLASRAYSALQLKNGGLVVGTISKGLFHLDPEGRLVRQYDQLNGLGNNTVLALFEDLDGTIWLGLDNGVSYINPESPFTLFEDKKGDVGSVYAARSHKGFLYLGSNQGLFCKPVGTPGEFSLVEGTKGQVWSLDEVDGTLFCGHHTGTFVIEGTRALRIDDASGTWKVARLPGNPQWLIQGKYDGLSILEQEGTIWKVRNKIDGFEHSSRFVEVLGPTVFVNHEYKGIFKVTTDSGYTQALEVKADTTLIGYDSGILKYGEDLLYAYPKGIFRYDPGTERFVADTILGAVFEKERNLSGRMHLDEANKGLWLFGESNIYVVSPGNLLGNPKILVVPLAEKYRNGIVGYESLGVLPEPGHYLIGTRSGYMVIDLNRYKPIDFRISLASVQCEGRKLQPGAESLAEIGKTGEFSHRENNLDFSFFTGEYLPFRPPMFQYRLEGFYPDWSPWSENPSASFRNLPPGNYTFQARARIGDQLSGNTAEYTFVIARPWYRSRLMWGLYALMLALSGWLIHLQYRNYYRKKQNRLMERNQRELDLTRARNEREIVKLKNDQLRKDFRKKSNELAASTMSIIKKNEILNRVRKQIQDRFKGSESIQPIIQIIDQSLRQDDDWELFKEAFTHSDREFLNKLKTAHPELSPNDIRLCAYLRLNLTSKEIAPLFNISTRSVEIKRYRLRKKMNLEHDENLVNYLLSL